jgi:hypothetical protein
MQTKGLVFALLTALSASPLAFAAEGEADNGTDPSKLNSTAIASYEYLDLGNGFSSGTLKLTYQKPFLLGDKQFSMQYKVPVAYVDAAGNDNYDLGDASLKLTHVLSKTKEKAIVLQGELVFDTAGRPELGSGKNVFKGTFIYAKFLKSGAIFAPAVVQSNSLWGDDNRSDINNTTLDFYYVPKLKNPKNLITYDPSLTFDWENDRQFAGLAVTFGRVIGPAFGGNAILSVKPSILAGNDRSADWGVEVIYKVIGF